MASEEYFEVELEVTSGDQAGSTRVFKVDATLGIATIISRVTDFLRTREPSITVRLMRIERKSRVALDSV